MNDKIKQMPGTEPRTSFSDAVLKMVDEMPVQIEYIKMRCVMIRRAYQELINNGFSKSEALELCTKIF